MTHHTYICTTCRISRRAGAAGGLDTPYKCVSCGQSLWELSPTVHPQKGRRQGLACFKEATGARTPLPL